MNVLDDLFHNKQVSAKDFFEYRHNLKHQPELQQDFIDFLLQNRKQDEMTMLTPVQLILLSKLCVVFLDNLRLGQKPTILTLHVINTSVTFAALIGANNVLLSYLLLEHPALRTSNFWINLYELEIHQKYSMHQSFIANESSSEDNVQSLKTWWRETKFSVLNTFSILFSEYGQEKNDLKYFIQKMNEQYQLNLNKEEAKMTEQLFKDQKVHKFSKEEDEEIVKTKKAVECYLMVSKTFSE
ncbi:Hypothetical_protein [Hexamita inflata]|uniref:Hypothetical_protein n=1 Tax=Hexamita inflata TaxID=28002 RepID=A0AA86NXJ3_9EUKA|nr:Hypothetical protein HINF_LOCUS14555 [Hexamita inflata]